MAKRKRAPHEKPFSRSMQPTESSTAVAESAAQDESTSPEVAAPFVGKWNQLVSTTNWEKGQIICEWRDALEASGAAVTEYSDDAWAQLVGGVTSQHVGRLRRVSQRFGDVSNQYEGLYWSHFQACLDWDDAEMWLEGSIQNGWSVSQMRGKRWETLGTPPEEQSAEAAEFDAAAQTEAAAETQLNSTPGETALSSESASNLASQDGEATASPSRENAGSDSEPNGTTTSEEKSAEPVEKRTRLSVDVESLPDDLAEAFESFKLAIIAHRRENWRDTTVESVVECLDSLKTLALADSE